MKAKGTFKVYFDTNGDLLRRLYFWHQKTSGNYKEEDNHIFKDRLEYSGYAGPHIYFTSLTTGRKYHMFLSDFNKMMLAKRLINNIVEGEFTFTKKGVVQGCKLILPKTP